MHTPVAQVSESFHLAAEMCTQGAVWTHNIEHCYTRQNH